MQHVIEVPFTVATALGDPVYDSTSVQNDRHNYNARNKGSLDGLSHTLFLVPENGACKGTARGLVVVTDKAN